MTRKITFLLATFMIAGCGTNEGLFIDTGAQNSCGSTGYTFAGVVYGDSYIIGFPYSEVVAGAEFQIILETFGRDSAIISGLENRTVQIEGKSAGPEDDWLNASGVYSVSDKIVICIPDTTPGGDYDYLIHVDGVGTLDPRARIINRPEPR